jgi:hypothetical protein
MVNRLGHMHFANDAFLTHLSDTFDCVAFAAILSTVLDALAKLFSGLDQQAAFPDAVAAGFLDIHMLARYQRRQCNRRMPMVRRGNTYRIDALVVHDAAIVLDRLTVGFLRHFISVLRIHIADRHQFGFLHVGPVLGVIAALAADTNYRYANPLARGGETLLGRRQQRR